MQLQFLENKEKCVSVYFRANSFEFKYNHTLATKKKNLNSKNVPNSFLQETTPTVESLLLYKEST